MPLSVAAVLVSLSIIITTVIIIVIIFVVIVVVVVITKLRLYFNFLSIINYKRMKSNSFDLLCQKSVVFFAFVSRVHFTGHETVQIPIRITTRCVSCLGALSRF